MTLFVPGYFTRCSPSNRSRSAARSSTFCSAGEQLLSRSRAYSGPCELPDFTALAQDLRTHMFDFTADMVDSHGDIRFSSIGTKREQ
jgi:hypothetical protein